MGGKQWNQDNAISLKVYIPQDSVHTIVVHPKTTIRSLYKVYKKENRVMIYNGCILDKQKRFGDYDFHHGDAIFAVRNSDEDNTLSWVEASQDSEELCFRMEMQTNPGATEAAARIVDLMMTRMEQKSKYMRNALRLLQYHEEELQESQIPVEIPDRLQEPSTEALPIFWTNDSEDSLSQQVPCVN